MRKVEVRDKSELERLWVSVQSTQTARNHFFLFHAEGSREAARSSLPVSNVPIFIEVLDYAYHHNGGLRNGRPHTIWMKPTDWWPNIIGCDTSLVKLINQTQVKYRGSWGSFTTRARIVMRSHSDPRKTIILREPMYPEKLSEPLDLVGVKYEPASLTNRWSKIEVDCGGRLRKVHPFRGGEDVEAEHARKIWKKLQEAGSRQLKVVFITHERRSIYSPDDALFDDVKIVFGKT